MTTVSATEITMATAAHDGSVSVRCGSMDCVFSNDQADALRTWLAFAAEEASAPLPAETGARYQLVNVVRDTSGTKFFVRVDDHSVRLADCRGWRQVVNVTLTAAQAGELSDAILAALEEQAAVA
jgi:hypothetical protein